MDAIEQASVCTQRKLDGGDVAGLKSLGTAFHGKFDALSLFQGAEAIHLDSGEVDEDVFAVIAGDEAVAFAGVEPFDGALFSCRHGVTFTPVK